MKMCRDMIKMKVSVFLVMFLWILAVCKGDTEVSCGFMERCILPCSFQVAPQVVIHWTHLKTGLHVHSFYDDQDELGYQHQIFRNRTSLFKDQISRGNASLQLTGVKFQDEGRYQCFISTINRNKVSFIDIKVDAPVHQVNIQLVENRITCSSEGIYPEPELTWSTTPPSNINPQNTTRVQNEEQLYNISSSLILSHSDTDLVYSCTVKTHNSRRIATLSRTISASLNGSSSETKLTCGTSKTPQMDLIWRFNHSQTIVDWKRTSSIYTVSEKWRQQVKDVSESGDLTLKDLCSLHEGLYTCELSDAEVTSSTFLKPPGCQRLEEKHVAGIAAGVTVGVGVIVAAVLLFVLCRRRRQHKPVSTQDVTLGLVQIAVSQFRIFGCTTGRTDG